MDNQQSDKPLAPEIVGSVAHTLDALKLRLAAQVAPLRWRRSLLMIADACESGKNYEMTVNSQELRISSSLQPLLKVSLQVPDPTQLVLDAIQRYTESRRSWRRMMSLVAYPIALLLFALIVGAGFGYVISQASTNFIEEFGLVVNSAIYDSLDDHYQAMVGLLLILGWTMLVGVALFLVGPPWAWSAVVGGLFIVGRPLRWTALRELVDRFFLIEKQAPTAPTAELVSSSFSKSSLERVAALVGKRIQSGSPLGAALSDTMYTDGLCRPALLRIDALGDKHLFALESTVEVLSKLIAHRCQALSMVVPAFVMALVGSVIWSTVSAYINQFIPLVSMITSLA